MQNTKHCCSCERPLGNWSGPNKSFFIPCALSEFVSISNCVIKMPPIREVKTLLNTSIKNISYVVYHEALRVSKVTILCPMKSLWFLSEFGLKVAISKCESTVSTLLWIKSIESTLVKLRFESCFLVIWILCPL